MARDYLHFLTSKNIKLTKINMDSLFQRYVRKEISEKTFSVLIAKQIGFSSSLFCVLKITKGKINECLIPQNDFENLNKNGTLFLIRYDFRLLMTTLDSWLKKRNNRPKFMICRKDEIEIKIYEAIKKGKKICKSFFIIIEKYIDYSFFGMSTLKDDQTILIDVSKSPDIPHGSECLSYQVKFDNEINVSIPYLTSNTVKNIIALTKKITDILGDGAIVEWRIDLEGRIFINSAKKSKHIFSLNLIKEKNMLIKTIFPGKCRGKYIEINNIFNIYNIVTKIKKDNSTDRKFIFYAESMSSDYSVFIPYANGFIFNKGSILCHLSLLLREKKIPSCILNNPFKEVNNSDDISLIIDDNQVSIDLMEKSNNFELGFSD